MTWAGKVEGVWERESAFGRASGRERERERRMHLLRRLVSARQRIGSDKGGNVYYMEMVENVEKRSVQFAKGPFAFAEPESLPVQWQSWLAHRRSDAPSEKEMETYERQQSQLAKRVADMEEEDSKLRMQQFQGTVSQPSSSRDLLKEAMGKMDG